MNQIISGTQPTEISSVTHYEGISPSPGFAVRCILPRGDVNSTMPTPYLSGLIHRDRTVRTNRQLGFVLTFVAGAVNAGGFLAVQRYTSHMTGIVSAIADDLVLGQLHLVLAGVLMLAAFIIGAITTTLLIRWARHRDMIGEYALPLMIEALLLLVFGVLGSRLESLHPVFLSSTALLLCFVMGLQNAIITKISKAEIRTTHLTGIITDLGIEVGRLLYGPDSHHENERLDDHAVGEKLRIHFTLLSLFIVGALTGAFAFRMQGFSATLPLAAALMSLAGPPLYRDLKKRLLNGQGR